MLRSALLCVCGFAAALIAICAEPCSAPPQRSFPENTDFAKTHGWNPDQWAFEEWHAGLPASGYQVRAGESPHCHGGFHCATISSTGPAVPDTTANLLQSLDIGQLAAGKHVILRADLRVNGPSGGKARAALSLRITRKDCSVSYSHGLTDAELTPGAWSRQEIVAPIDVDARELRFGVQFAGDGGVTIDNLSLKYIYPDEWSVRAFLTRFAEVRNAHDGVGLSAMYVPDGEWRSTAGAPVRGRLALAEMWSRTPGQVTRKIDSVEFPTTDVAVARVNTQFTGPAPNHKEVFVLIRSDNEWRLVAHESLP